MLQTKYLLLLMTIVQFSLLCKIHALTQEEVEEEAVLWANLKRNLANKALVCLHTLSIDVTDRCCNG